MTILRTERLALRPLLPDDAEDYATMRFHPEAWGQGYATEVAEAALDYGFGALDLGSIFAITFESNLSSQAVMKRIGLTYRKRVDYKGFTDIVWFDIDRAAYAERTSTAAR